MMEKNTKVIVILSVICVLLQVIIAPTIAINSVQPDFLLLPVVATAVMKDSKYSCILGFAFGLLFDLIGVGPIGAMSLVFCIVGYIAGILLRTVANESPAVPIAVFAACSLLTNLLYLIILSVLGYEGSFFSSLFYNVLPCTLYDVIFAFICFPIIYWQNGYKKPKIKSKHTLL